MALEYVFNYTCVEVFDNEANEVETYYGPYDDSDLDV